MHDAFAMRSLERAGDCDSVPKDLIQRDWPLLEPCGERLAVQVLQHQEIDPLVVPDVVQHADVRVIQGRYSLSLALELPFPFGIVAKLGWKHFDRNGSVEARIPGSIDFTHSAGAHRTLDLVGTETHPRLKLHRDARLLHGVSLVAVEDETEVNQSRFAEDL